jgi:hypothetical protein
MFTHVKNPYTRKDFFNHFATFAGGLLIAKVIGNVAAHAESFDKPLHTNGAGHRDALHGLQKVIVEGKRAAAAVFIASGRSRTERGLSRLCQLADPALLAKERCSQLLLKTLHLQG